MSNVLVMDMTFDNPVISSYFNGDGAPPVREFLYIHTHHIPKNFLTEIEILVRLCTTFFATSTKPSALPQKLAALAKTYAELINDISSESAVEILAVLKEIFLICDRVIKTQTKNAEVKK